LVLILSGEDSEIKWRDLESAFVAAFSLKPFYFRFKDTLGHIVIERSSLSDASVLAKGIDANEKHFEVKVAEGADLKAFYAEHGDHYNMCLKNQMRSKQDAVNTERTGNQKLVQFLGKKYANTTALKTVFKNIITRTLNGDRIKEPYNNMLKEIIKFHSNGEKKMENFDHFTVNVHPTHNDSRCFFVVRQDGSSEVFAIFRISASLSASRAW
jgi:hypothetical protein